MSLDLLAPASAKVLAGNGGGTSPSDTFVQQVVVAPNAGSDGSGTVAAGGTAQNLFSGVAPVNGFMVQNTSDTDMWISDVAAASAGGSSIYLAPLSAPFVTPAGYAPGGVVSLFCATTGKQFMARKW